MKKLAVLTLSLSSLLGSPALGNYGTHEVSGNVMIVGNDSGGLVYDRIREVKRLIADKIEIRVTGRHCYSSCTLYLRSPYTCVAPYTKFGFHGPSLSGKPLEPEAADMWRQAIAAHYPAPLAKWYLSGPAELLVRHRVILGRNLEEHGIKICDNQN